MQTDKILKTEPQQTIGFDDAYRMMLEDYQENLTPTQIDAGTSTYESDPDKRKQLRRSVVQFALEELDLLPQTIASDLSIDVDLLISEIQEDDLLTKLTQKYASDALAPQRIEKPVKKEYYTFNSDTIGWISDGEIDSTTEVITSEKLGEYEFADLTGLNNKTRAVSEDLKKQGVLDKALEWIKTHGIEGLEDSIKRGGSSNDFRVVNYSKGSAQRKINTSLPAYKFGVFGSNDNRAILIIMGKNKNTGRNVYGLGAVYDHDDQEDVYRVLKV